MPVGVVEHLLERYGTLTVDLLALIDADPLLGSPLAGAPEYLAAEVAYAAPRRGRAAPGGRADPAYPDLASRPPTAARSRPSTPPS